MECHVCKWKIIKFMRYIYNNILPPRGYKAITLYPFVFVRKKTRHPFTDVDRNHEEIHGRQYKEMLWIGFLLWYVIEYLIRLVQYHNRNKAYHNISFEREAYANQGNLDYLKTRKHYAWIKYLRK